DQLGRATWPSPLRIVAIDGRTGIRHVFDRDAGVPLARAVAASTAIPALVGAVPIGGSAYFDAGVADTTSADLAAGYDRVTIIVPNPRPPLEDHVRMLRAGGAEVVTVLPSDLRVLGAGQRRLDAAGQPESFALGERDGRSIPA
ncbi:MAG TPA: patatin-like phospholipase family protein, partial [Microbacterium sp.]|uniref:patatin-like phospholipase family protein n=1 Tax=Microbacterium sp. TaxID=51671 RepID=UPI002B49A299